LDIIFRQQINNLIALYEKKKYKETAKFALKLIKKFPKQSFPWKMLGIVLKQSGKLKEALVPMQKSIQLAPQDFECHYNLGITLKEIGKLEEAEKSFRQVIKLKSDHVFAHNHLGIIFQALGKLDKAEESYKQAIKLKPDFLDAHNNLGNIFLKLNKLIEAEKSYRQVIKLNPNFAIGYYNLGVTLYALGKFDEAEKNYKQAIKLKPDFSEAYDALAVVMNLKGDLISGLKFYEWRLHLKKHIARLPRKEFLWDLTKSLKGKRFVVYAEQGIGDIIQFYRFLLLLEQKGAKVTFIVKKNLHHLLRSSSSEIKLTTFFPEDDKIDFESPLMSIPYLLKTEIKTIPNNVPYLKADSNKIVEWNKKLSSKKFKVGICWQGSKGKIDVGRSFPLTNFRDISKIPNIELISLYKGDDENKLSNIDFDLTILGEEFDNEDNAFIDTAAVMMCCDLIITVDTSIAHLAGALGCPVWTVLKYIPDWRWMLNRKDSPWYPTMRLYRQNNFDKWKPVLNTIKKDLELLIKKSKNNTPNQT
jgi:tetratricopeptide (TPR) repeat protein